MNAEKLLMILAGLAIGALFTCQAGVNSHLKTYLAFPVQAAFISFFTGTMILALICVGLAFVNGSQWVRGDISAIPWWAWTGGMIGAFNVSCAIILAPRLGAILLALTIVGGQIFTSILLEHYGAVGYPRVPLSLHRVIGSLMVVAGVFIVLWPFPSSANPRPMTPDSSPSANPPAANPAGLSSPERDVTPDHDAP